MGVPAMTIPDPPPATSGFTAIHPAHTAHPVTQALDHHFLLTDNLVNSQRHAPRSRLDQHQDHLLRRTRLPVLQAQ